VREPIYTIISKRFGESALRINLLITTAGQMRLIKQLDEEDKQTIFRLIEKMLTNKKFKDFFAKNVAAL